MLGTHVVSVIRKYGRVFMSNSVHAKSPVQVTQGDLQNGLLEWADQSLHQRRL